MTILQAFILGIIQGATEFLPISSSGHLVLVPHLLGWTIPAEQVFVFDTLVQMGTLVAVIIYFWRDLWDIITVTLTNIWRPNQYSHYEVRLGIYLIIASIPAMIAGFLLLDSIEAAFHNPKATAGFLLLTAALLLIGERLGQRRRAITELHWHDALVMGLFQALALFPGVSRSGATITGGLLRNLERPAAARFSFLMSVPVMLGAGALALLDLFQMSNLALFSTPLLVGFLTAAVVGYLAIDWLIKFLGNNPIYFFSIYLVALSLLVLVLV